MLLPLFMLYRQAYELQLKSTIKELIELRKKYEVGDMTDVPLQNQEAYIEVLGHNFHKLLNAVRDNFCVFPTGEQVPNSICTVVMAFHQDDKKGTAFRYPNSLPKEVDVMSREQLVDYFNKPFNELSALVGCVSVLYENID